MAVLPERRLVEHEHAPAHGPAHGQRQPPLSPPDSRYGLRRRTVERQAEPTHQHPRRGPDREPQAGRISSSTVWARNWRSGSWKTYCARRASAAGDRRAGPAEQPDRPGVGPQQADEQACQGRLAAAVRADEGDPLAGVDAQLHVADDRLAPVEPVARSWPRGGRGPGLVGPGGLGAAPTGCPAIRRSTARGEPDPGFPQPSADRRATSSGGPTSRGRPRRPARGRVGHRPGGLDRCSMSTMVVCAPRAGRASRSMNAAAPGRIEVRGRLVEDQDARARRQDAGQRQALLLAAGQPVRAPPLRAREPDLVEDLRDAGAHVGGARPGSPARTRRRPRPAP